ncbi:MAG: ROK family protein [Flavipsychrobacter sp.]
MTKSLALGIDIGGTNTTFGLVNRKGEILFKGGISTPEYEDIADYIFALKEGLMPAIELAGIDSIVGVGVGAPNGNYFNGEIAFAPNLPWKGIIPLAKLISEAIGLKVTLTNDAKAAALGEMIYGRAKGMKNFIQVTLGTGVGSGFIANGQLIYGHDGFAGELGHITVVRNGRKCGCGRFGCLETYASATGIVRSADELLAATDDVTPLRDLQGKITARDIHLAAENGDLFSLALFEYTGMILGEALATAVAVTSPEAIILFGGLANAGKLIIEPTKKHMEANLLPIYQNKIEIHQSALDGSNAAILGASALVW